MMRPMKTMTLSGMIILLIALVACASSARESTFGGFGQAESPQEPAMTEDSAGRGVAPQAPAPPMPAQPAPAPVPAPAAPAPAPEPAAPSEPGGPGQATGGYGISEEALRELSRQDTDQQAALVAQQRIIVRTVDMQLVVTDIAGSVDEIADMAEDFGGWVVSSDRSSRHRGSISIRVPAQRLDEAVMQLRGMAVDVDSEVSTSQDVTDEYVDNQSRLTSLQATEQALINLLDRAESVEDALNVQRELASLQADIESIQGRLKFLEETAAFSLVNIDLRLAPVDMPVDAGPDRTFSVGHFARFRATFQPPEGIDEFTVRWDFGDGTPVVTARGTAPTPEEGTRITATVNHSYADDRDSPFIVEVTIEGTGDAGVAEGSDTFIATVTKLPTIEVFAGESFAVEEDEEVEFEGSFTRPEGLTEIQYTWDFGDGSAPVVVTPEEGVTRAVATHKYADHRPFPYTATLTVKAQSEAGEVEASNSVSVLVTESKGFVVAGWSAGDTGKTAVRALSGVAQGLGTLLIWLAIFSPVWLIGGAAVVFLVRRIRSRPRPAARASGESEQESG